LECPIQQAEETTDLGWLIFLVEERQRGPEKPSMGDNWHPNCTKIPGS